jgi:hypothetical protein
MDKEMMVLLIPILGIATGIIAIMVSGVLKLGRLRLEKERLHLQGGDAPGAEELNNLRGELDTMRAELNELQERMDFAERLLANPKPKAPPA